MVRDGITFELSDFGDENGRVTNAVKVFQNGQVIYSGSSADGATIVENGKIVFDGGTADVARWLKQRSATAEATEEVTTEATGEATSEAITVVQNFWEAINQKNVDEAMTYIADDAILMGGQYEGKEQIRKWIEGAVRRGTTFELSEFKDEDGQVTYTGKVFEDGNEVYSGTGVNIVENGKIVFDGGPADVAGWLKQRSAPAEATGEATSEAITIVQNFYEAINQKKIDEAMTYVADDAIMMGGQYTGKEQIRKWVEDTVQKGDTFDLSDLKDEGGRVTYTVKVSNNGKVVYSGTGVDIVENGKIVVDE